MSKPSIYVFVNARYEGQMMGVVSVALSEDGDFLASHMSSNESWARHDMGVTGDWKHDKYQEKYPDGFEVIWCEHDDPRVEVAYQKHLAKNTASVKA